MNEFKFSCPSCQKPIAVAVELVGQLMDCPDCQTSVLVPVPPGDNPFAPAATPFQPVGDAPTAAVTLPGAGAASQPPARPVTTVAPMNNARVAVLTPEIKIEIIRAARSRLADQSRWLHGQKGEGQYNYAARREGDQLSIVSPTDASATHLSLFGALMLELHRHNVTRITTGRQEFLNDDLAAAIDHIQGRLPGKSIVGEVERGALTYEQCLAVLDELEKRQAQTAKAFAQQQAGRKIANIRLADLLERLVSSAPIQTEEVVCALYHEVEGLKQRIAELEQKGDGQG